MKIEEIMAEKKELIEKSLEKYVPRKFDAKTTKRFVGTPRYSYDYETATKSLSEPIWDLFDRGGKRLRPVLYLLTLEALSGDEKKYGEYCAIMEAIHSGTLCIDDIQDSSEMRRGKPCLHKIYGIDIASNAGNALYFLPLKSLMENKKELGDKKVARAYEVIAQEMINVSMGQAWDIYWHRGLKENVSEGEYLQMCAYKTGSLTRLSCKLAGIMCNESEEVVNKLGLFGESIGVGFQIQDDVLNLTAEEEYGKEIGGDVSEGKRTLIVLHSFKNLPKEKAKRLKELLNSHTKEQGEIREAISLMKEADSIEYAKIFAKNLVRDGWKHANSVLEENESKQKLKAIADYLVERKY